MLTTSTPPSLRAMAPRSRPCPFASLRSVDLTSVCSDAGNQPRPSGTAASTRRWIWLTVSAARICTVASSSDDLRRLTRTQTPAGADAGLGDVLASWYYAGFYLGRYHGAQEALREDAARAAATDA